MINITELDEMFDGDKELICDLFSTYLEDHQQAANKISQLINQQQFESLFHLAHNIYGTLANLAEDGITPELKELENAARSGTLIDGEKITKVKQGLNEIEEQMNAYITDNS